MASAETGFFGRRFERVWLQSKLFPNFPDRGLPPVVLLHGTNGIGKSALVRQWLGEQRTDAEPLPLLVFESSLANSAHHLPDFVDALLRGSWSTVPLLHSQVQVLPLIFAGEWGGANQEVKVPVGAYNLDGSARPLDSVEPVPRPEVDGGLLAQVFIGVLERWLDGFDSKQRKEGLLRLLFVLDAFAAYAPSLKIWLGQALYDALRRNEKLPPAAFLLMAGESWEAGGQADYWQAHPGAFHQRELGPLSRSDCLEWLKLAKQPAGLVDFLLEETEGIPARIEQLLSKAGELEALARVAEPSRELTIPLAARERRWLHAAAMAERITQEALQVLLGQTEGADAFRWLSTDCHLDALRRASVDGEPVIFMGGPLRERILKTSVGRVPARHREFLEKFEIYSRVTSRVPSSGARQILRQLAPLQPFSKDMLREVFSRHE